MAQVTMDIIGHCPKCGAPIYGPKQWLSDKGTPPVQYTCTCRCNDTQKGWSYQPRPWERTVPYWQPVYPNYEFWCGTSGTSTGWTPEDREGFIG